MDPRQLPSPLDYLLETPEPERPAAQLTRVPQANRLAPHSPVPDPWQSRMLLREQNVPRATTITRKEINDSDIPDQPHLHVKDRNVVQLSRTLDVPRPTRRRKRTSEPSQLLGLQIRPEERQLLMEVGKFRVISTDDLARFVYKGNAGQLERDLQFLHNNNLVEVHVVNARRDGRAVDRIRRFEAVTLTPSARKMLERSGELPENQRIYSDLVKVREVEHDSQIYRAYLKELAEIEQAGGRSVRVQLDFELKAKIHRGVYLTRKDQPGRDLSEIKAEVAEQFHLTVINNKVVIPDARIEYELPNGSSAQIDIEVATSAYRRGHLAGKSQAGFRLYISSGDIGRLGPAVQDDHDLMSEILDF
jgi:hypothetical protein